VLADTKRRAAEMEEYKTAMRKYKGKGKSTAAHSRPKYDPNIPPEPGLHRSNEVLADTISHWHSSKGHMSTEMDMVVPQITQELVPL
jgi:hypothetical protein